MKTSARFGAALAALFCSLVAVPAALCAPGDLDPGFGDGGRVTSSFGDISRADAAALQADGKLVVAGAVDLDLAIARYLPDGSPDPDFGSGGLRRVPIADLAAAIAVAVQADGAIVAAGFVVDGDRFSVAIVRTLADGTPDSSFGAGGIVTTEVGSHAAGIALALTGDDGILVGGTTHVGAHDAIVLLRYRSDGEHDRSFGKAGKTIVRFPGDAATWAMARQPDGRIVVGGYTPGAPWSPALLRFLPDGKRDPTFGEEGTAVPIDDPFAIVRAVAVQLDGRILAAFESDLSPTTDLDFAVARLEADGSLDTTFGTAGIAYVDFGTYDVPRALALLPDGSIAVGGDAVVASGDTDGLDMALARLTRDGQLDAAFGAAGGATVDFRAAPTDDEVSDYGFSLLAEPDGQLVLAGLSSFPTSPTRFATISLARLDGAPTTCGDGTIDAGEECDLGGANGAATACCTTLCRFATRGTACRASTASCDPAEICGGTSADCPADVGTADADGDGTCDPLDGCTSFGAAASETVAADLLAMRGATPAAGAKLSFSGRASLPAGTPLAALAPFASGARVFVEDDAGARVAVDLPGGLAAPGGARGWRLDPRGQSWTYRDRSPSPLGGIRMLVVRDRSEVASSLVDVEVRALGIDPGTAVATPRIAVSFGRASDPAGAACVAGSFAAGECTPSSDGRRLRCRR